MIHDEDIIVMRLHSDPNHPPDPMSREEVTRVKIPRGTGIHHSAAMPRDERLEPRALGAAEVLELDAEADRAVISTRRARPRAGPHL